MKTLLTIRAKKFRSDRNDISGNDSLEESIDKLKRFDDKRDYLQRSLIPYKAKKAMSEAVRLLRILSVDSTDNSY